jgi:cation diffusion facilitator family transporter
VHGLAERQTWDPFPPGSRVDDSLDRRDAHRALGFSALGLALTGAVEIAIALLTGSVGLLGDALHNLSDVSTSAVVFVGFRLSRRPATPSHPYGWQRAEDIAGLGVAVVIWASAVVAGFVSLHKLLQHGRTTHVAYGMAAAAVGILGNQLVARYKLRVGRRIQSATLIADAQHSWLDALSSAGALLGLIGVTVGFRRADAIAGLVVTAFIVHVGYDVTRNLVAHLMDSVDTETLAGAERAARGVDGVHHAHVRGRWLGRSLVIEVEGYVDPITTVSEAQLIGRAVETAVTSAVPQARAVLWLTRPMPAGT